MRNLKLVIEYDGTRYISSFVKVELVWKFAT